MGSSHSINRSKFFRPVKGLDLVDRKRLSHKLDQGSSLPLTVISTPAGYGKSTLVASWLDQIDIPNVWISLEESDSDLNIFIAHLNWGIQSKIEGFGTEIDQLLKSPQPTAPDVLINKFVDLTSRIEKDLIIILDDYHQIIDKAVHELLLTYLKFPNHHIQLIVISRSDPPLSLNNFRLKGWVVEIRTRDLRFNRKELKLFLRAKNLLIETEWGLSKILKLTEGWAAGLRLLVSNANSMDELLEYLDQGEKSESLYMALIVNYLEKNRSIAACVIRMSVLEEFNHQLSDHILDSLGVDRPDCRSWIQQLVNENFFLVPLDENKYAYRFHHLINNYLVSILKNELDQKEILKIHHAAAQWYQDHCKYTLAVKHYIKAEDHEEAIHLFETFRLDHLENTRWIELEQLYRLFPKSVAESYPILLLTKCWLLIYQGNVFEMFSLLQKFRDVLERLNETSRELYAEVKSLEAYEVYIVSKDYDRCLEVCEYAIEFLPASHTYALGYAWIFLGGSLQVLKNTFQAVKEVRQGIESTLNTNVNCHQWLVICYLYWIEGGDDQLRSSAESLEKIALSSNNLEALANAYYFLGIAAFSQGELDRSLGYLSTFRQYRYQSIGPIHFMSMVALSHCLETMNDLDHLTRVEKELATLVQTQNDEYFSVTLNLSKADNEFRNGDAKAALHMVKTLATIPLVPASNFYLPQITLAKILISSSLKEDLEAGKQLIAEMEDLLSETKNKRFTIPLTLLRAQLALKEDIPTLAGNLVNDCIHLSKATGIIQPFLQIDKELFRFVQSKSRRSHPDFYARLQNYSSLDEAVTLDDPSYRELEVLKLLTEQLSNKQIAEVLFISEKTVKRHCANLFKKLGVKNRREAVNRGRNLKLII